MLDVFTINGSSSDKSAVIASIVFAVFCSSSSNVICNFLRCYPINLIQVNKKEMGTFIWIFTFQIFFLPTYKTPLNIFDIFTMDAPRPNLKGEDRVTINASARVDVKIPRDWFAVWVMYMWFGCQL